MTFDILGRNQVGQRYGTADWQVNYEAFARCRHCLQSNIFVLYLSDYQMGSAIQQSAYWSDKNVNGDFQIGGFISVKDFAAIKAPEHLPAAVMNAFSEAAACLSIGSYNAAGAMFRLSIDLATKDYLPDSDEENGPNRRQRKELAHRLQWLFEKNVLPADLRDLASSVREDGNDSVHDGTLTKDDAEDLADFAVALLTRIHTEPARIDLAKQRRQARRETNR